MSRNYRFYCLNYVSSQLFKYRYGFDLQTSATGLVVSNRLIVSSFVQKGGGVLRKKKVSPIHPKRIGLHRMSVKK
jgi:hypothetical protein